MWKKVKQNGMAIIAPAVLAPAIGAVLRIVTMSDVGRVLTIPAGFCVGLAVTCVFLLMAVPLRARNGVWLVIFAAMSAMEKGVADVEFRR